MEHRCYDVAQLKKAVETCASGDEIVIVGFGSARVRLVGDEFRIVPAPPPPAPPKVPAADSSPMMRGSRK